eukprot:snap_masked-scaffold_6-processed-gene-16.30-mRNA-1 protein AED:0.10 eAED:0.14 QI:0/-1/0/1/-1/1/1/0/241
MTDIYTSSDVQPMETDVREETEPCNNFRLDTTSAAFGMCKCGFPKAQHGLKKENRASEMLTRLKNNNKDSFATKNSIDLIEPGDSACNKFRLDVSASEFGMCKCGYKRAEHEGEKENKAKAALDRLKASNADQMKDLIPTDGPCNNYRVDVSAAEFGTCHCGFKKEDHKKKEVNVAAQMLANMKEKNQKKNEIADLEAIGIVDDEPEETPDEVAQLTKVEEVAGEDAKPQQKKKKKRCTIS